MVLLGTCAIASRVVPPAGAARDHENQVDVVVRSHINFIASLKPNYGSATGQMAECLGYGLDKSRIACRPSSAMDCCSFLASSPFRLTPSSLDLKPGGIAL